MLPSRGVLRSLPSARATSSISSQALPAHHRQRRCPLGRLAAASPAPWPSAAPSRPDEPSPSGANPSPHPNNQPKSRHHRHPHHPSSPPPKPTAAAAEPVSIPAEPSTLVDPTASSLPSIDAATLLDLPEQIGYLKTLGLDFGWGPSSVMQWALEHVHVYSGLPWISSITLPRLLLLKPLLKAQETSAKLQLVQQNPQYEALKKASVEALSMGDTARTQELRRDLATMNKRAGVNPFNAAWGFLQIPFGYGMFRVLNGASSIPVPGFENGGFGWITDLSVPDPLYILPILGPISMFAMMK
uniref:Mitochondrial export translocase n=1 Tax=Colletotrichum fructicola (strain Nara gc5) TaxID=1213859 RepID=L2G3P6_COLFN